MRGSPVRARPFWRPPTHEHTICALVPTGANASDEGMPMAVQLVAAKGKDQLLLGMGEV